VVAGRNRSWAGGVVDTNMACRGLENGTPEEGHAMCELKEGRAVLLKWERQSKSLARRHGKGMLCVNWPLSCVYTARARALDLRGLFTLQLSYRDAWTRKDRMASDDEVLITGASFIVMRSLLKTKSRRKRRWWMTSVSRSRDRYSGSDLLCYLHFRTFCRMSYSDFDALISLVGPRINKKHTSFRKAVPVAERLAVNLRFLASGD
jgi:hypothetical protein